MSRPDLSDGYMRAGGALDRRSVFRWWIAVGALVRRGMIDKGTEPHDVERDVDDAMARVVSACTARIFRETIPMRMLDAGEVQRIAAYLATRVRDDLDVAHPHYPNGWRGELAFIRGDQPREQPRAAEREPGEDDDE